MCDGIFSVEGLYLHCGNAYILLAAALCGAACGNFASEILTCPLTRTGLEEYCFRSP